MPKLKALRTILCSSVAIHVSFACSHPATSTAFQCEAMAFSRNTVRRSLTRKPTKLSCLPTPEDPTDEALSASISPSNGNTEKSRQEQQYEKLQQLNARLQSLQEEQAAKEDKYQTRIRSVVDKMDKKEKELLEKVQYFASQLQQYRFDSQKSLLAAKEASQKKELELKRELRKLRFKVQELEGEYGKAKELAEKLKDQRDALEKEVNKLKETYAREITEWENRYESEQDKRKREERRNQDLLKQADEAAKKRELERVRDCEEIERRIQTVYEMHLAKTERMLTEITAVAQDNAGYIEQLESERVSLRRMYSQTLSLLSARLTKGVAKFLRKKTTTTNPSQQEVSNTSPPDNAAA